MNFEPVILSAKVAVTATIFTLLFGIALARIFTKRKFFGQTAFEVFIVMPMILPPSVTGYALLILFGRNGFIGKLLYDMFHVSVVFSWIGAVIASFVVSLPLMYQSVKAAFQNINPIYENAARTLGASERRVFWTVTLPLSLSGIVSGIALSFARALGEFGATLMVAGNIPGKTQTIPLAIYFAVDTGDNRTANILVITITIFSFILIYILNYWLKRNNSNQGSRVK